MKTALIGIGAHGRDIAQIWKAARHEPLRFYDELKGPVPELNDPHQYYLGPYDPHTRRNMWNRFIIQGWESAPPLVHPSAGLGDVKLGMGVVVARSAVLDHSVNLGLHTHVNYNASMTRCSIGSFCTISPGVTICGDVTIGEGVFIGAGAVITNLITIGDDALIGAGAVILENVLPRTVVVGNPGRIVNTIGKD